LDYTDALVRYFTARLAEPAPFWKRVYLSREARRIGAYEAGIARRFDACLISSPQDRDALYALGAAHNLTVVSNGASVKTRRPPRALVSGPVVLFVGNLRYPPNQTGVAAFCREVWPLVKARIPAARFLVVGQLPRRTRDFPGAEFTGLVPEVGPYYAQARLAVCPLTVAAGRQFKVIEAFAAGVPVVATPLVARNLDAVSNRHLLAADLGPRFAAAIIRLCGDDGLARRLRRNARTLAERKFDWETAVRPLLHIYTRTRSSPARR
jgi:glycosyltransferase involved in cell wall biosynthesis